MQFVALSSSTAPPGADLLSSGREKSPAQTLKRPRLSPSRQPPRRLWITSRNLCPPQRDHMAALVGIAPNRAAIRATQASLQFMDRCRLWSADDVERDGLVRVAPEAADLKISIVGIQCFAESGGRLGRPLEREHTFVPGFDGQAVGLLTSFGGTLRGSPDRRPVYGFPRLRTHRQGIKALLKRLCKSSTCWGTGCIGATRCRGCGKALAAGATVRLGR